MLMQKKWDKQAGLMNHMALTKVYITIIFITHIDPRTINAELDAMQNK